MRIYRTSDEQYRIGNSIYYLINNRYYRKIQIGRGTGFSIILLIYANPQFT